MTTFQKAFVSAVLVAAIGAGIYEGRQTARLRGEVQALQQQQAQLSDELRQAQQERDDAKQRQASLLAENGQLKSGRDRAELLKLRGEVSQLRPLQADVVALQKLASRSASGLSGWKRGELTNAGRATPLDALQTFFWSSMTTNLDELKSSFVGDLHDPPDADAFRKYTEDSSAVGDNFSQIKVLGQTLLSPDEARLQIVMQYDDSDAGMTAPLTLQNVDGEWKVVVFNQRDADGKVTSLELMKK